MHQEESVEEQLLTKSHMEFKRIRIHSGNPSLLPHKVTLVLREKGSFRVNADDFSEKSDSYFASHVLASAYERVYLRFLTFGYKNWNRLRLYE
ncbi:hypothetical protein TNCT_425981 [Trichonephila clavata]|uniref:Uncharacterized protein n=1 Tax=Trichonephila clavata TaxID=2740835 RepID=A0A8X6FXS8_TRICU|nr:hypothetical protein TNCT_425981 [Trichonephila clavata]